MALTGNRMHWVRLSGVLRKHHRATHLQNPGLTAHTLSKKSFDCGKARTVQCSGCFDPSTCHKNTTENIGLQAKSVLYALGLFPPSHNFSLRVRQN